METFNAPPPVNQSKPILAIIEAKAMTSNDTTEPTLISPCESQKSLDGNAMDGFHGEEDNTMSSLSVPHNISMMSSISCLSEKETLSDEESSSSGLERGSLGIESKSKLLDVSSTDDNPNNSAVPQPDSITFAQEELLSKIEAQSLELRHRETIVLSQRNELKQYNTMISKYRDSIRTKNNSIQALEFKLRKQTEVKANEAKEAATDSTEKGKSHVVRQDSQHTPSSLNKSIEDDSEEYTIERMKNEMESLRTIVTSLTTENNTYRRRENDHLQKISASSSQVQSLLSKNNVLRESLDASKRHSQNLSVEKDTYLQKVLSLEERLNESQIQIFELGQKAINVERESESKQNDISVLERLLAKSREVATVAFQETNTAEACVGGHSVGSSPKNPLSESLKKELEATRKREQELRSQLCKGVDADGTKLANDSIMDKLAESQQEAIQYLTGEVEELRVQLEKECRSKEQFNKRSMEKEDRIKMMEHENVLITSELILHEKKLETLQNNFSIKSGENVCLRDEVKELCSKIDKMKDVEKCRMQEKDEYYENSDVEVTNWKVLLEEKCNECNDLTVKLKSCVSKEEYDLLNIQLAGTKDILHETKNELSKMHESRILPDDEQDTSISDHSSDSNYPMVTIDINGNEEVIEDVSHHLTNRSNRRLSLLKKAMQKSYEEKMVKYEAEAKEKNDELDLLRTQLDSLAERYDEDIKEFDVQKICFEAETHYEQEQLRNSLSDRDQEILILKSKVCQLQQCSNGVNWQSEFKYVSETISSGVEASIDLFNSMSFHEEDEKKLKRTNSAPISDDLEISVPLKPSKTFSSFHVSEDELIEGREVERRAARRTGKPPLASSKSFG